MMKKFNELIKGSTLVLIVLYVFLNAIDTAQTLYYLNAYGFEHEQNPLVTNNFWIFGVKMFFALPMTLLMLLLLKIPDVFNGFKKSFREWFVELIKTPFFITSLSVVTHSFINLYWVVLSNQYYVMLALL